MTPAVSRRRLVSMKLLVSTVTAAIVGLTMLGAMAVAERNTRQAVQQEMKTRLVLAGRHLALLAADALLADFPELTLCPAVRELRERQPDLSLAAVLDHDGRLQGHPDVRRLGQPLPLLDQLEPHATEGPHAPDEEFLASDALLAVRVPVRHRGGQVLGSVVVARDRDDLAATLAAGRRQLLLVSLVMALLGIVLTTLTMRRLLAPLDALRAGLERIGAGDLRTPIELRSRTELGLLADTIDTMAADLDRLQAEAHAREQEVIATQSEVIHTLGEVVESRSHETGNHIDRVARGAALLARLAGLPDEQCELIRLAAPMHDVGKIGIPDAVLNKPGKLTDDEFALMKTHTRLGHQILAQSRRPIMQAAAIIALQHHERWDGRGYPDGRRGEAIHVYGRIVAVVDVFDALTSDRCYRPAMSLEEALQIMREGHGSHFDPHLLDLFLANIDRFSGLMESRFNAAVMQDLAGEPAPRAPGSASPASELVELISGDPPSGDG
jgi:HD-GYP domain-containing protein (c-di-GMP phosphodiesterase class II)